MTAHTLALHMHGPLQSWGPAGAGNDRGSLPHPTRSGIVGMLACALGIGREDVQALRELDSSIEVAVRIDDPGVAVRDYRTARVLATSGIGTADRMMPDDVIKARLAGRGSAADTALAKGWMSGDVGTKLAVDTYRGDARFVAAVSADAETVERLARAVRAPRWPLYIGRSSCPTPLDLSLGVQPGSAREVLSTLEWQVPLGQRRDVHNVNRTALGVALTVLADAAVGEPDTERVPGARVLSLAPGRRLYRDWQVKRLQVQVPDITANDTPADPFDLDL